MKKQSNVPRHGAAAHIAAMETMISMLSKDHAEAAQKHMKFHANPIFVNSMFAHLACLIKEGYAPNSIGTYPALQFIVPSCVK